MKRIVVAMILAAMLGGLLSACGGMKKLNSGNNEREAEPVKIMVLNGMIEAVDWLNGQIQIFNARNPGIKVEQEFQKEATVILKMKIAADKYPDILFGCIVSQTYLDQDLFHDFSRDDYWDKMTDPGVKSLAADRIRPDKNFSLPFNMSYMGMFYNKRLIDELDIPRPDTWEQFMDALQTIKEKRPEVTPLYFGGKDGWTLGKLVGDFVIPRYVQKYGVDETDRMLRSNDPRLAFDEPGGTIARFAGNLMELQKKGLINKDAINATYADQSEAIATGQAGFVIQGMWALNDILSKNADPGLGIWPIPSMYGDVKSYLPSMTDGSLMYFKETEHEAQIEKFIDFLTRPEALKSFSKLRNAPSLYKDGQTDWSILSGDVAQITPDHIVYNTSQGLYWDQWGYPVQDLLVGGIRTQADFADSFKKSWGIVSRDKH